MIPAVAAGRRQLQGADLVVGICAGLDTHMILARVCAGHKLRYWSLSGPVSEILSDVWCRLSGRPNGDGLLRLVLLSIAAVVLLSTRRE